MKFQKIVSIVLFAVVLTTTSSVFAQAPKAGKHSFSAYNKSKSVSSDSNSNRFKYYFLNGLREKTLGNTNGAIRNYLLCLDSNPTADAAYYELSVAYLSLGQDDQALQVIDKAIKINPEQKWYFMLKADVQQRLGLFIQSAETFGKINSLNPEEEENYYSQANAWIKADKPEEAMKVFRQIEDRFGASDELIFQRKNLYIRTGNIAQATREMENLIRNNPDELRYYMIAAELYDLNNMSEKAFEKYQQALKLDPSNGFVHLALADYYKHKGNKVTVFEEVKKAFFSDDLDLDTKIRLMYENYVNPNEQVLKAEAFLLSNILVAKYPNEPRVFAINGDFLYMIDRKSDACEAYKKVVTLDKRNYSSWERLAQFQLNLNDYEAVQATCNEALIYFPDKSTLYLFNGLAKKQTGNSKEAIVLYNKGLYYSNGNIDLQSQFYSNIGEAYRSLGNYIDSDKAFEKSIELNPNNAFVLNNYAYYLSMSGKNLDKAERMIKKANAIEPGNSSYEDTYAWVLYKIGRYTEARIWIEKAMRNKSNSATFAEHYGDILFKLGFKDMALINWKKAKEYGSKSESLEKKINDQALHD